MTIHSPTGKAGASALLAGLGLLALAPASRAAFSVSTFATGAGVGTAPDSVTVVGNSVYVEYGNGADSAAPIGTAGFSTIARYDLNGALLGSLNIQGSVDGLRFDPYTNLLWALQNQDGNSALTTVDLGLTTGSLKSYTYATTSTTRGYDDAQFLGGNAYLSYTNPGAGTDPVVVTAAISGGQVLTTPFLTQAASGVSDIDALNLLPGGSGLLLTGGDDGGLSTITNLGTGPTVSTVTLNSGGTALSAGPTGSAGLDDAVYAPSGAQTLLVAGTSANTIYRVTGAFTPGALYASVGQTSSLDLVGPNGAVTPAVTGLTGTHGLAFLPAAVPEPAPLALLGLPLAGLLLIARRRRAA